MADPLGSLEKIVKLALRIKEAVDTVRQNKEECQQIRTQVLRISTILSHQPETRISGGPEICAMLDDLEDALRHAHALVTACCQESSTVCLYCRAGKQAKKLRRAQDDIGQKMMMVVFATNIQTTSIILTSSRIQDSHPLPTPAIGLVLSPPPDPLELPDLTRVGTPTTDPPPRLPLSTIIRNEVAKQGIRLAANVLDHSLFTSDSDCLGHQDILTSSRIQDSHPPAAQAVGVMIQPAQVPHKLPQVGNRASTVIRNELTRAIIRCASKGTEHSLFSSDSDSLGHQEKTSFPYDSDIMSAPGSCTKIQEADATNISQNTTPPSYGDEGLRKFNFSELEAATDHFSVENMVGSGAFATVYKGVLHDGLVIAVKKFQYPYVLSAGIIDKLHLVSNLTHKNIVKLIGYSGEVTERAKPFEGAKVGPKEDKEASYLMVEEYFPNGSLDKNINGLGLDWSSRFRLIQGIAHGLCYLHEQDVIHMDVKPSNILLDADMNPKITDFGIAKKLNHKGVGIYSDSGTIAGTLGYMPPEYITDGTLSKKHDVYGFGATLLEIVSGMSRTEQAIGQASIEWAWKARQAGGVMELLDPSLYDAAHAKEIERCVEVGLLCTQFDPAHRPDMQEALEMLRGERALRTPVRPGYTKEPGASWFGRWR